MKIRSIEAISATLPGYKPPQCRRCRECGRVMRPEVEWKTFVVGEDGVCRPLPERVPVRVLYYGYCPEGLFCSLRCGYMFAVAAAKGARPS